MGWRGAFAGLCLIATGCSSGPDCGAVGCGSEASIRVYGLTMSLRYPLTMHACFDKRCVDAQISRRARGAGEPLRLSCRGNGRVACADLRRFEGYSLMQFLDVPAGTLPHRVTLRIRDAAGKMLRRESTSLTLTKRAPNGAKCGPICWLGHADFR
jgi:hypothetical protein